MKCIQISTHLSPQSCELYITDSPQYELPLQHFPALHLTCHELHSQISVKCSCCICWSRSVDVVCTGTWEVFVNRAKARELGFGVIKTFSGCWRNFRGFDFSVLYLIYSSYRGHNAREVVWVRVNDMSTNSSLPVRFLVQKEFSKCTYIYTYTA